jgi:lipid A 3-O-deacylase
MIMARNLLVLALVGFAVQANAQKAPMPQPGPVDIREEQEADSPFYENRLDLSVETGVMFDIGNENTTTVSPVILSLRWQLDEIGNPGWRRGYTEWVFSGVHTVVWEGVESRFSGALFGPRYYFVQPGSKLVPYVDSRVGFGFTDSQPVSGAQGQDFYFTFTVGVGARYLLSEDWDIAAGIIYQHISNAGLSEPDQVNNGLDTLGPHLSFQYRF